MGPISSARNPLVKRIRLLADRRHRRREGACVVRGIQPVWQAVAAGAEIEAMVIAPELLRSPPARRMVEEQRARGVRVVELTAELVLPHTVEDRISVTLCHSGFLDYQRHQSGKRR